MSKYLPLRLTLYCFLAIKIRIEYSKKVIRSVKCFTIFWLYLEQFSSSRCFCRGRESEVPNWTIRCWVCLRFRILLAEFASMVGRSTSDFRPIRPCMIIEVLATGAKFLEPSAYCNVMICAFKFRTTMFLVASAA